MAQRLADQTEAARSGATTDFRAYVGTTFEHDYSERTVWQVLAEVADLFEEQSVWARKRRDGALIGRIGIRDIVILPHTIIRKT